MTIIGIIIILIFGLTLAKTFKKYNTSLMYANLAMLAIPNELLVCFTIRK